MSADRIRLHPSHPCDPCPTYPRKARRQRNNRLAFASCLLALLPCCLVALLPLAIPAQATQKPKYNVLFIASDDLRPTLGAYGDPIARTPNIDRLAARGVRFERAYAQYPLCNPSRTSLLTGRYPTQTGVLDNNTYFRRRHPDWATLPQHFKSNGYATLRAGKIFHGGIDDMASWTEGGEPTNPAITERGSNRPPNAAAPATPPASEGESEDEPRAAAPARQPQTARDARAASSDRIVMLEGDGEAHGDYKTATRAINYLERYQDKPFFLSVGFVKPHSPPTAPKKLFDLYDAAQMPLPPDFAPRPAAPAGFPELSVPRRNADLFIGRDASPDEAREMMRAYYASTSFMDAQVGRVLDALDRLGLRDKTIVVFWGDHGYHLGEKGKWSKAYSLFEVGDRVPLIIAVPGAKARQSARAAQLLDMYPTLVELCGLPRPQGIEGHSLAPLLRNPAAAWPHAAYTVTMFQGKLGKAVRTERWRYAEWEYEKHCKKTRRVRNHLDADRMLAARHHRRQDSRACGARPRHQLLRRGLAFSERRRAGRGAAGLRRRRVAQA